MSKSDDTISRQAAIDALEKVAELFPWRVPGNRDSYDRYNEAWNDAIGRAEIEIEELRSAQTEIIHCHDCKHWREGDAYSYCQKLFNCGVLDVYDYMRAEDDFCSLAERRTDGV